jgi:hypothetical protein
VRVLAVTLSVGSRLIPLLLMLQLQKEETPNKPAAGKAGIARLLAIGHHWPGLPEKV